MLGMVQRSRRGSHLVNTTRQDTSDAAREVARHAYDPPNKHWGAVIKILQYLRWTHDFGLTDHKYDCRRLHAFAETAYAKKAEDQYSVPGGVVTLASATVPGHSSLRPI